jgi:hypothetical protein
MVSLIPVEKSAPFLDCRFRFLQALRPGLPPPSMQPTMPPTAMQQQQMQQSMQLQQMQQNVLPPPPMSNGPNANGPSAYLVSFPFLKYSSMANAFISPFNTQALHIKSVLLCFPKNLIPGGIRTRVFLFPRRMRCPLCLTARASEFSFVSGLEGLT